MTQPFELGPKIRRFSLVKKDALYPSIMVIVLGGVILWGPGPATSSVYLSYLLIALFMLVGLVLLVQSFQQLWVDVFEGGLVKKCLFSQQETLSWRDVAEIEFKGPTPKEITHSNWLSREPRNLLSDYIVIHTQDDQVFSFSASKHGNTLKTMIVEGVKPHLLPNILKELDMGKEIYIHELLSYNHKGVIYFPPKTEDQLFEPKENHIPWSAVKIAFDGEQIFIKAAGIPLLDLPVPEIVNYFIFLEVARQNQIKIANHRAQIK